jgi:23S rRNA pseudouridine1911/1915/1917 synthase
MKRRRARRSYLAIVTGSLRAESGVIEAPIGRSARRRTSMAVSPEGRPARSFYRVIERFSRPLAASYLEVGLDTGRTHQIRVHLAAIGHPVLGDTRYGGRRGALPAARPMLHASALELEHPESGLQMSFTAPLPEDFLAILGRLS